LLEGFEEEEEDGGDEEGEDLGDEEAADDAEAKGLAAGTVGTEADGEGDGAKDGAEGGHKDGAEAFFAGGDDGVLEREAFALALDGEVHDHDAVFLDETDEEEEADEGVKGEVHATEVEGEESADAGGGKGAEDGDGVDVTFVEDAENDIHDEDGDEEEDAHAGEGLLKLLSLASEGADDAGGEGLSGECVEPGGGFADGEFGVEVEKDGEVRPGASGNRRFDRAVAEVDVRTCKAASATRTSA